MECRPYEPLGMTTEKWMEIPPTLILLSVLTPSQQHTFPDIEEGSTFCGDPIIHVVLYQGIFYISDGHHRVERAKKRGDISILCRLIKRNI